MVIGIIPTLSAISTIIAAVEKIIEESLPLIWAETIIKKSEDKNYMKEKYGCTFCAFYHKVQLAEDQLKNILKEDISRKVLELDSIIKLKLRTKSSNEEFNKKISQIINNYVEKRFEKLKEDLPSLCIIKNKANTRPCFRYTLRVLHISTKDRLNFQNSKINRRYTSLGVFLTIVISIMALTISIFSLLKP